MDFKKTFSIIAFSLMTLSCICFISCGEDGGEDEEVYVSSIKGIAINDVVIAATANSTTVSFGQANLSNCTVVTSISWCNATISKSSVVITAMENNSYEERISEVTVTDRKDNTKVVFKVVQKPNEAYSLIGNSYASFDFTVPKMDMGYGISIGGYDVYEVYRFTSLTTVERTLRKDDPKGEISSIDNDTYTLNYPTITIKTSEGKVTTGTVIDPTVIRIGKKEYNIVRR